MLVDHLVHPGVGRVERGRVGRSALGVWRQRHRVLKAVGRLTTTADESGLG